MMIKKSSVEVFQYDMIDDRLLYCLTFGVVKKFVWVENDLTKDPLKIT